MKKQVPNEKKPPPRGSDGPRYLASRKIAEMGKKHNSQGEGYHYAKIKERRGKSRSKERLREVSKIGDQRNDSPPSSLDEGGDAEEENRIKEWFCIGQGSG